MTDFKFDPIVVREQLLEEFGVERYLSACIDDARTNNALEGYAEGMFGEAVRCMLVGLFETGNQLLSIAREWLGQAIDSDERPSRYFKCATESSRYDLLAMCNWMLESIHDGENLEKAVRWQELWFEENGRDKDEVGLTLPMYLDARDHTRVVALFESCRGMKMPKHIRRIKSEGTLAFVLAKQALEHPFNDEDVEQSVSNFLNRSVPELLGRGHYLQVARWMKILFWKEGVISTSSVSALLKCYDYLEEFTAPQAN